jgi:hypothetical protein
VPPSLARVVEEHYLACDAVLGKVLPYVDEHTLCIVFSHHGMNSFQLSGLGYIA